MLTLFRIRRSRKALHTSFSSLTSTNVGISPKTFWLLVLTLLPHWYKISSSYLVPVPNYWTWTKTNPQKSSFIADIIETLFTITICKYSRKVEINRNYVSKGVKKSLCIKRLISWCSKICCFPAKKYWCQQN